VSNPSRVLYVGSLFANAQVQSVVECARAVGILADSGRPIRMDIHSPSFLAEPFRHQLCHHPSVHLHDTIRQDDEFFATIAAADILLLPVNFDSESIRLIRYSMPTKLPAYLISGTPILAYGPNRVAQMEYLHDTGSAVLVNDRDERRLVETIARLLDDAALRRQVVGAALANHDMASVRTAFQKNLVAQARRRV
jgi:glycosyltransferase involved in cell wall biosynthesis